VAGRVLLPRQLEQEDLARVTSLFFLAIMSRSVMATLRLRKLFLTHPYAKAIYLMTRVTLTLCWLCILSCSAVAQDVQLQSSELNESSGIAEPRPGEIWTHNDSGDSPRFFVFGVDGRPLAQVWGEGLKAIDWEDMCSFTRDGRRFVAVGDVGDNARRRPEVTIYVLEVAADLLASKQERVPINLVASLYVTYPDGPVDCETLAYDPVRKSFLLASKELLRCRLFEVDARVLVGKRQVQAKQVGSVLLPMVTAGDISMNGDLLVLATYGPGCLIRRGQNGQWQTQGDDAVRMFELPPRRQGESICFAQDGHSLWLSSEKAPSPLFKVPLPDK
jgi:hypothetical protein